MIDLRYARRADAHQTERATHWPCAKHGAVGTVVSASNAARLPAISASDGSRHFPRCPKSQNRVQPAMRFATGVSSHSR